MLCVAVFFISLVISTCVTDPVSPTLTGLCSLCMGGGQAVQLGQIDFVLKSCTSLNRPNLTLSMISANFLYGSKISEVDLKSKVGRFVSGVKSFWFQVVT